MAKNLLVVILFFNAWFVGKTQYTNNAWTDAFEVDGTGNLIGDYCNGDKRTTLVFADRAEKATKLKIVFIDLAANSAKVVEHEFKDAVNSVIGGYNKAGSFVLFYETITGKETGFLQEIKSLEISEGNDVVEKSIAKFSAENKTHFGRSKFSQSPDLKKSLIFIEAPFTSGQKENITMIVYDENGKEESNNTVSLDLDSKMNVHNYPEMCNNGNIFFLKKDKDKNLPRYFIYAFDPSIKDLNHKLIAITNASITEIKGQVTPQNEYLVGGFTASEPIHVYEGYYLFKFDATCSQKFKTQGQLDEPTMLRFMSKKDFSKDPALKDYYIDNIIILETGKIFIASEMYREENISKTETWVNYKDLMFVCFDASGKYKTTFNYKKNQSLSMDNSHWASYRTFPNKDTLVIAHNYIVKTEGKKVPEPLFTLVNVHEKYGTKTLATNKIGAQPDTPFFVPHMVYNPNTKQYLCLFSDFAQTKFRLGIFDLE